MRPGLLALAAALLLAGCVGGNLPPVRSVPAQSAGGALVYDARSGPGDCRVSADGAIWYAVPAATFPPVVVNRADCPGGTLSTVVAPRPHWAAPGSATQALLAAVSLVGSPGDGPLDAVARLASNGGVPITWLVDRPWSPSDAAAYDARHRAGDDVAVAPGLTAAARAAWPWYAPAVAVLGAGGERKIAGARAAGDGAFWGITWNSNGTDATFDRGAPWGAYCADPASYKRPDPSGDCSLVGVEWTARDLTAAYLTGREDAFSTDPDDVRTRSGIAGAGAQAAYLSDVIDAYAAAGQDTPLLVVVQQEASEQAGTPADGPLLAAVFARAKADGLRATTLADAVARLRPVLAQPRAVAFPALPSSSVYGPATIDFHDAQVGLTFRSGETLPARVFDYAAATSSAFNVPLPLLAPLPQLLGADAANGTLRLRYRSASATRFGAAFWADPAMMGWTSPNVFTAGRAGAVAVFDLPAGDATITLGCRACSSTTFPLAP